MNVKSGRLLLAVMLIFGLTLSVFHNDNDASPGASYSHYTPSQYEYPRIGSIEAMCSYVDPWGGVTSVVGALHNNTHYNYTQYSNLDTIVKRQMEEEDGYVARASLTMQSHAVYPNGKLGSPIAVLYLDVNNILIVNNNYDYSYTQLDSQTIISLADEVAIEYEDSLGIDFVRLVAFFPYSYLYGYPYYYGGYNGPQSYTVIYVALLSSQSPISIFQSRISALGGFMSMADPSKATSWPNENTFFTEIYMPVPMPTDYYYQPFNVLYLYSFSGYLVTRAPSHITGYQWEFQSAVLGQASCYVPEYIQDSAGEESYSFKQHVGYTNDIQNKMYQDSSCESISIIGGAAPSHIELQGVPLTWEILDEDCMIPQSYYYPGFYLPEGPVSGWAEALLAYLPRVYASSFDQSIRYMSPEMFNYVIDSLWSSTLPPVDYSQLIRSFNWSDAPKSGCVDMNYDLLTLLMSEAGMTPQTLVSLIDKGLAEDDPGWALVKAFIDYFDNYHLLDFLDNDIYADPKAVGEYIDQVVQSVTQILKEQGGIDLPSEFQTKEALADFVEAHWDITLQALWDALASFDGDTTTIKTVVQDMLDTNNLREHLIPYIMADLGRPVSAGMGFVIALNMNFTAMTTLPYNEAWIMESTSTADIMYDFEVSLDSVEGSAPYLHVVKTTPNRVVDEGATVPFTITVTNLGSHTAYDIKVLDGSSSGLDGDREFYWTKDMLAPDEEWIIEYSIIASDSGLYVDMPALCAYFNTTLSSYNVNDAMNWDGSAFYTISSLGYKIQIGSGLPFNFGFNLSTIVTIGSIGVIAVVVVLWVKSRK